MNVRRILAWLLLSSSVLLVVPDFLASLIASGYRIMPLADGGAP